MAAFVLVVQKGQQIHADTCLAQENYISEEEQWSHVDPQQH